jgi:hypothetical protein
VGFGPGRRSSATVPLLPSRDPVVVDSSRPLENFALVRSRDVEEVRHCLARIYAKPVLVPACRVEGFNAAINACELGNVGLLYSTFGAAMEFEFPPIDLFCQLFPIRGNGETTCGRVSAALSVRAGAVTSAQVCHKTKISADYEHLVLRINAKKLTEKLTALTGVTLGEPLRMEPLQDFKHPAAQMLQHYVPLLTDTLREATAPLPEWWIAQTEELLMTLYLFGHRHNYSHLLERAAPEAAPRQVRQAEEYIEANAQRAVTLEELAEVTGVSAFSLFAAFRKFRGYSPSEFLLQVRSRRGGSSG